MFEIVEEELLLLDEEAEELVGEENKQEASFG
jgi:hypothetical protein